MDSKSFKNAVDLLVKEKGIDENIIYEAMELALTAAYKKNYNSLSNVRVDINRETGEIKVYSYKTVVDRSEEEKYKSFKDIDFSTINEDDEEDDGGEVLPFVYDDRIHLTLEEARKIVPDIQLGETIEEEVTPKDFGRVAAATAKQVIVQKIREAEKDVLYDFLNKHNGRLYKYSEAQDPRSAVDPRAQNEDLGDDPVRSSELGIANLKRIVPEIIKWTTTGEKGQTYEEASRLYYAVITQWNNYLYHVMANIGGIYIENTTVGDGVKTYTYVEKEKQEASLDFLLNEVLCYPRWLFDTEISDYTFLLRKNPTGVIEYAPSQILKNTQGYIFWDLLSNDRLMRMLENELKNGKKAFTVVEMMDKMHNSIFATTIKGGTPDVMERNLQKGFLDALITAAAESEGVKINKQLTATSGNPYLFHHTPWCSHNEFAIEQAERMGARRELSFYGGQVNRISDAISVKRGELLRIKKLLESRRNTSDTAARYHYDDMILRINTALGLKD